jgi:GTP cyclohydrolase I
MHTGIDLQLQKHHEAGRIILQVAGEKDLSRPGIKETPKRMINALLEMTWGARVDETEFLQSLKTTFDEECDQMIKLRNIEFVSLCEHHVLPFLGTAAVAYIPRDNRILGLSKLVRLVQYYGARLQIQERMTRQIATALIGLINPLGVGVCLQARHLCMEVRGVRAPGVQTITSDLRGAIRNLGPAREEFFLLTNV